MKKVMTSIVTALTVFTFCVASVFAAGSTGDVVDITSCTDGDSNTVAYTVSQVDSAIPPLTIPIASSLNGVPENELRILWQMDVTAASLPATITYHANGTEGRTLYSFHWNGSAWELMNSATGPSITTTYQDLSPVGLVVRIPADSASSTTTSPTTGNTIAMVSAVCVFVVAAGAAAYVVASTKKA